MSGLRELRFGPDPYPAPIDPIKAGNELTRIIKETMERMRTPLWFWSEAKEN